MKLKPLLSSFILVSSIAVVTPSYAFVTLIIADPVKSADQSLKMIASQINSQWRVARAELGRAYDKAISEMEYQKAQLATSGLISAKTTAISEVQNARSEEVYKTITVDDVCRAINTPKAAEKSNSACDIQTIANSFQFDAIDSAIGEGENPQNNYTKTLLDNSTDDKDFLEKFALTTTSGTKSLTSFTRIESADRESVDNLLSLLFDGNVQKYDHKEIEKLGDEMDLDKLESLRKSLLYRSFIQSDVDRRTGTSTAPSLDFLIMDDGSSDALVRRKDDLDSNLSSEQVWRLIGLYAAKDLRMKLKKLKFSMNAEIANALKLKELERGLK